MRRDLLLALALFAVGLWHNLAWVDLDPSPTDASWTQFHRDEARWVGRAFLFTELRDPQGSTWEGGLLMYGQPPLGSYLMGLGLTLQGRDTTTTRGRQLYSFYETGAWNRVQGRVPAPEDVLAGRRTNAVVGALLTVAVFFLARRLVNRVAGVAAALALVYHPLATHMAAWAGSDALLALLVALAALAAVALAERPSWPRAVLLGVLLGLGGATKLTPMLVALPLAAIGVALLVHGMPWRNEDPAKRFGPDLGWMLLTLPLTAFAAFVASYPYLWPDPLGRTKTLFAFRVQEMEGQGQLATDGPAGWERIAVNGLPDAISRTVFWLGDDITTSKWLAAQAQSRLGRSWDAPWLDLALSTVGLGLLGLVALAYGLSSRHALGLAVLLGQAGVTWVGMQADFDRYQMPILVAVVVGVGAAIGYAWAGLATGGGWLLSRAGLAGSGLGGMRPAFAAPAGTTGRTASLPSARRPLGFGRRSGRATGAEEPTGSDRVPLS